MHRKIIAAGIAIIALGGVALAEAGPGPRTPPLFLKLDRNDDAVLDKAEALQPRQRRFAKMDANGDGRLTTNEIDGFLKQRLQRRLMRLRYRMLARFDANGDGVISKEEFTARALRRFARADLNGDGRVTPEELRAARKFRRHRMRRMRRAEWRRHLWRMRPERPGMHADAE